MPARVFHADQSRALLYHARNATPFCSADGEPCCSVPSSTDSRRILPIRSAAFRDWLTANYYKEYERAPSADALRSVLRTLEARARYEEFPKQKIDYRVSFEGDPFTPSKIFVDLANAAGETVEITSTGWTLANNLRHCFREFSPTLALPRPAPAASGLDALNQLAELCRLNQSSRTRVFTWISSALRPVGPYPILVLKGPAASGKSLLARALRALIDPSAAPLRRLPLRDRDLLPLAFENWVLAFDHVQRIPSRVSEALCSISSGDSLEIAQPDFRDPVAFQIARPIILTVPNDETQPAWTPPRTLSQRTLTVDLPRIPALRPESAIWSAFELLRPALLAAFYDALAAALRRIREIDLASVARLPDCATWAAAAAPALALEEPAIVQVFADPESMWIGSDPLRDALYGLLRQKQVWTGDASTLLNQLRAAMPFASLPNSPRSLSQILVRIPGIRVTRAKDEQSRRILSLTRTALGSHSAAGDAAALFDED
jgi:putative DNA primase/helicase